ncbi:MAG: hypothetical protein GF331_04490 [Chitinivibrionales bacterium]|nr:hypothetical protein [Chitinivibrionales bacterium]
MICHLAKASAAALVSTAFLASPAHALDIAVDCTTPHQTIHGFGTCIMDWRTNPNVQDLYDDPAFQHNYVDTMGMSVVRVVVEPEILFTGGAPMDYDSISYLKEPWDFERCRVRYEWSRDAQDNPHYEFGVVDSGYSKAEQVVHWARDISAIDSTVKFIATPWSPPAWMKRKDWTTLAGDSLAIPSRGGILLPQYYRHFGKFLAEWVKGMKAVYDVDIYAVSLQNEPLFSQSYNSCTYTRYSGPDSPGTYYEAFKEVVQVFQEEGLGDMRWFGAEDMTKFPERSFDYVRAILDDPVTRPYLTAVAAHGYSDGVQSVTDPADDLKLWEFIEPYGKEYWMTETGGGEWLWPLALEDTPSMLHNMLTYGHCALVAFWQIAGAQVSGHELMDYDQHTKKSYSFMHFSKFIRPNAVRVDASPSDSQQVSASAYYHPAESTMTVVLLNHATSQTSITISFTDFTGSSFQQYRTSADDDFQQLADLAMNGGSLSLDLAAQSVVTLTGIGSSTSLAAQNPTPGSYLPGEAKNHHTPNAVYDIAGRLIGRNQGGRRSAGACIIVKNGRARPIMEMRSTLAP